MTFLDAPTKSRIEQNLLEFFDTTKSSVADSFTVWNAHKAFIRGILIYLGARARRRKQQHIQDIVLKIGELENQNKMQPSQYTSEQMTKRIF